MTDVFVGVPNHRRHHLRNRIYRVDVAKKQELPRKKLIVSTVSPRSKKGRIQNRRMRAETKRGFGLLEIVQRWNDYQCSAA
jgi:hypothetical protein